MKSKPTPDVRWIAIREGGKYCAPACGKGCTYAEYRKAKRRAAALAKRLGAKWTPRVWENLGWHYEAALENPFGRAEVHGHERATFGEASYTAFIHHLHTATAKDPRVALAAAVELFKAEATREYELMRLLVGAVSEIAGEE